MAVHPNTLRFIDRYVGVPLCVLFSVLMPLLIRRKKTKNGVPDTIVLLCIAEGGALLVSNPAVLAARRLFPDSRLCFLTDIKYKEMLQIMRIPDEDILTISISSVSALISDALTVRKKLNSAGVIYCAVLEPFTRFSHLLGVWIGAQKRAGCFRFNNEGGYLGSTITNRVVYNPRLHASQTFVALVEALTEPPISGPLSKRIIPPQSKHRAVFKPIAKEQKNLRERITRESPEMSNLRWIIINANASDIVPLRKWHTDNYTELMRILFSEYPDVGVILTGIDTESAVSRQIIHKTDSKKIVNLAGKTTFRELMTLYTLCELLISNDSGPIHFASATDIFIIALYGPEHPSIFGPLSPNSVSISLNLACSPCISPYNQKKSSCTNNVCMSGITVEQVLKHVRKALN